MLLEFEIKNEDLKFVKETLNSFIAKENDFKISDRAKFKGFSHRIKIESLKSFVV